MLNEGNQRHNFISSSGSDFLTSYGSGSGPGSASQKVTVPTVPVLVPLHCICECLATSAGGSGNSRMGGCCPSPDPTPSNKHSRNGSQIRKSGEANKPGPSGCGNSRMDPLPAGSATPRNKKSRTGSERRKSVTVSSDDEANIPGPSGCGKSRMGGHCPSSDPLPAGGSATPRNKQSRTGSERRESVTVSSDDEANKPGHSGWTERKKSRRPEVELGHTKNL